MKIKEMNEAERPREKLLSRGAQALSDGELLAILLRTGRRGESVLDLAQRILSLTDGRLTGLFECDAGYLSSLEGIGTPKAATLLAAFELGRRFMLEQGNASDPVMECNQVYQLMLPRLKGLRREECWIILLDRRNRILKTRQLTIGGGKGTIIDIPIIVKMALEEHAAGLILVHNHPSGDPRPSGADIRETSSLRDACASCGLALLDHLIVADEHFYSFNEEKMF
ncbi:MAG: DNA repair protein RadC [Bacteroidales bacterium]|nr:DNA repair protein RadC [Bacteroidales bacterium]